jgi:hypothetical protein
MPLRLVALDEGPDIPVDRPMVIVGRHPQCDARLDSIRVSRRHCCMTHDADALIVRDLGSTNGIRINGQRVEEGRIQVGDELAIAHIRYRLDDGAGDERTLAGSIGGPIRGHDEPPPPPRPAVPPAAVESPAYGSTDDNPLAAAVRHLLPPEVAERCKIQVIVQMNPEAEPIGAGAGDSMSKADSCRPDSSP